jgi:1-acyl-sn-glycerol-3-phosphate acyltransferase
MRPGDGFWIPARPTIAPLARAILRLRVEGGHNVPRTGPLLLVSNHESWWDIPALGAAQPRKIRFMAKSELFAVRGFGAFIRFGGAFPVRRGEPDRDALRQVREILAAGEIVCIFIQGHRQPDLTGAKSGAGRFAVVEDAPVVPAAVRGTREWKPGASARVSFGEPVRYERGDRRPSQAYRETADDIMARIRTLYERP